MGDYNITIEGSGCHDNGRDDAAEVMAAEFVDRLKEAGHQVKHATITVGGMRHTDSVIRPQVTTG